MVLTCIFGCKYSSTKDNGKHKKKNVTVHCFPKNETVRTKWLEFAKCHVADMSKFAEDRFKKHGVCSEHFKSEDYSSDTPSYKYAESFGLSYPKPCNKIKLLVRNAVPSIYNNTDAEHCSEYLPDTTESCIELNDPNLFSSIQSNDHVEQLVDVKLELTEIVKEEYCDPTIEESQETGMCFDTYQEPEQIPQVVRTYKMCKVSTETQTDPPEKEEIIKPPVRKKDRSTMYNVMDNSSNKSTQCCLISGTVVPRQTMAECGPFFQKVLEVVSQFADLRAVIFPVALTVPLYLEVTRQSWYNTPQVGLTPAKYTLTEDGIGQMVILFQEHSTKDIITPDDQGLLLLRQKIRLLSSDGSGAFCSGISQSVANANNSSITFVSYSYPFPFSRSKYCSGLYRQGSQVKLSFRGSGKCVNCRELQLRLTKRTEDKEKSSIKRKCVDSSSSTPTESVFLPCQEPEKCPKRKRRLLKVTNSKNLKVT